ncbi:hypothetical protein [Chitinophaga defluvii]|uniref:DUF4397 domain-containing protein n=1 Tax=Chitinophaga defluvii TaxID=3163343 RepID=A0ABV2T1K5_9BACT
MLQPFIETPHLPYHPQRRIINVLTAVLVFATQLSCEREKAPPPGTASLMMVNVVPGSKPLVTSFANNPAKYLYTSQLYYLGQNQVSSYYGSTPLVLHQYPDTTAKDAPLFKLTLDLPIGSLNSLFLTGTVTAPDTLFLRDKLPYHEAKDSTTGIRFIHLSPGTKPVNITIKGQQGVPLVRNLPYKGSTVFNILSSKATQEDYTFEFKEVATGALIASYTTKGIHFPQIDEYTGHPWLFRNVNLVLTGLPGSTGLTALTVIPVRY